MISMRDMSHYFYVGLACQNCFAHSVLVLIAISMALSLPIKKSLNAILKRLNTIHCVLIE